MTKIILPDELAIEINANNEGATLEDYLNNVPIKGILVSSVSLSTLEYYDLGSQKWYELGNHDYPAIGMIDGKIYVGRENDKGLENLLDPNDVIDCKYYSPPMRNFCMHDGRLFYSTGDIYFYPNTKIETLGCLFTASVTSFDGEAYALVRVGPGEQIFSSEDFFYVVRLDFNKGLPASTEVLFKSTNQSALAGHLAVAKYKNQKHFIFGQQGGLNINGKLWVSLHDVSHPDFCVTGVEPIRFIDKDRLELLYATNHSYGIYLAEINLKNKTKPRDIILAPRDDIIKVGNFISVRDLPLHYSIMRNVTK